MIYVPPPSGPAPPSLDRRSTFDLERPSSRFFDHRNKFASKGSILYTLGGCMQLLHSRLKVSPFYLATSRLDLTLHFLLYFPPSNPPQTHHPPPLPPPPFPPPPPSRFPVKEEELILSPGRKRILLLFPLAISQPTAKKGISFFFREGGAG